MNFYSTWNDVLGLGLDDKVFLKSFIAMSKISLDPLYTENVEEIEHIVDFLKTLDEVSLTEVIHEQEPIKLSPHEIPCFSTFVNGAVRVNEILEFFPDGLTYQEMGKNLTGAASQYAQIKYGENHAKLAAMMSLVMIDIQKPAVVKSTMLGRYLVAIPLSEKELLLKKLLLRDPCIQSIIQHALIGIANYRSIVEALSDSTAYRRRTSVKCLVEFALNLPGTKHLLDRIDWEL